VDAAPTRCRPALVRPPGDAQALVLGHGGEEGNEPAAEWRGEIEVRLVQHLDEGAAGMNTLDVWMPSSIDLVARSHSATTSVSPVPRRSIAFSSCGRPLRSPPDAFSVKSLSTRSALSAPIWRSRFCEVEDTRA
jgi:hypothetical protein